MLAVFTIPKPFEGHIGIIQRNALESWIRLRPECQVLVCGNEAGAAETAAELGVEHVAGVERNEFGTPLLDSTFAAVEARARRPLLCYVNADILLLSDFVDAAGRAAGRKPKFLMIGQRWDLDVNEPIDFGRSDWEAALRGRTARAGTLHPPSGSDYFVYPRGAIGRLPSFAVGRPGWDNWMIYRARRLGWPVVDATASALVIHQNHAYGHVTQARDAAWEGPEADRHRELIGSEERIFTIADATHRLTPEGLRVALGPRRIRRRIRTFMILSPLLRRVRAALRGARSPARLPRERSESD
ncbi:MAG: hypothetical protein HY568_00675 [Candidatus Latescibacteria bacterium]|nr:hypothetical protein [Candidatus Latescibacterota bacterium]